MYGTAAAVSTQRSVPLAGPAPTPVASNGRAQGAAVRANQQDAQSWTPWILVALLTLWVVWSLIEQHQKVKGLIQPKNIALNLRNLVAIILPVILGLALLRILLVKVNVWVSGIPYVSSFVSALIHLVG